MPDIALTTRISDETSRRLWLARAQTGRPIKEIVEQALREYLAKWEVRSDGTVEALDA